MRSSNSSILAVCIFNVNTCLLEVLYSLIFLLFSTVLSVVNKIDYSSALIFDILHLKRNSPYIKPIAFDDTENGIIQISRSSSVMRQNRNPLYSYGPHFNILFTV